MKNIQCRVIFFSVVLSVILSLSASVFAQSYASNVSFYSIYKGASRDYSGSQISIMMYDVQLTGATANPPVYSRSFTVECWKRGFLFFDTKLSGNLNGLAYIDGSGYELLDAGRTWSMIGDGKYYFKFIKNYVYGNEWIHSPIVNMSSN